MRDLRNTSMAAEAVGIPFGSIATEILSNVVDRRGMSGGDLLDSVDEPNALDDVRDELMTVEPAPAFLR